MKVTLIVDVPKLRKHKDATDFVNSLAEHIVETFNDDCSIHRITTVVEGTEKGTA